MWLTYCALVIALVATDGVRSLLPEYQLVEWRLNNYPPGKYGGRPVRNLNESVSVNLTFQLLHMNEVNDVDQTISVLGTLRIEWNDPFLAWKDSPTWNHIPAITVKPSAVWTPRILHSNNAADQQVVMRFGDRSQVTIKSNGSATWEPTGIFTSNCKLSLAKFPFDKQTCQIEFDSWLHYYLIMFGQAVYLRDEDDNLVAKDSIFGQGSVWKPDEYQESLIGCDSYCKGVFSITMQRNIQYFLYNIIIPCILLSILQLATFCLNPEAPDRPAFSVSVLVAFGIFQIMIQEQIPKTSELIYLLLYIIIQFAIGTVITIISTIFCYVIATKVALFDNGTGTTSSAGGGAGKPDQESEARTRRTLTIIRRVDLVAFIVLFAATGASHGVIFALIAT